MTNEKLTAVAVASGSTKQMTLASPEVVKALTAAVAAEGEAQKKWHSAAGQVYMAGVRYPQLVESKDTFDKDVYASIEQIVIHAQPASRVALLVAKSKIGMTADQLDDLKKAKASVLICMGRITEHLRRFEDADRGAAERKTFGEGLAKKCQDMIDQIRKRKEDDIDFDATESVVRLRELKACFLK